MRVTWRLGQGEQERVAETVRRLVSGRAAVDVMVEEPERAPDRSWVPTADFTQPVGRSRSAAMAGLGVRWNPGRRGAAALGLLVVLVLAGAGWWLATGKPRELPVVTAGANLTSPSSASPSASPSASLDAPGLALGDSADPAPTAVPSDTAVSSSAALLVIDVAGKVRHPGVYRLPPGSRVYQAITAAGGARAGTSTTSLNLAAVLVDGEQVVVGVAGSGVVGGVSAQVAAGAGDSSTAPIEPVDLNTATLEQLETLPGIGPALGQHVLDWRSAHGQFGSIDQLQEVSGIGPAKFAALRELVTV